MSSLAAKYIPAGCLIIPEGQLNVPDEGWILEGLHGWSGFTHPDDVQTSNGLPSRPSLPPNVQTWLLKSAAIEPFARLFQWRWIKLEVAASSSSTKRRGIVRVHLLPDDVDRRLISRDDPKLWKARNLLFSRLDFSDRCWRGECDSTGTDSPQPLDRDTVVGDTDKSLLQMFNNIPSPDPRPEVATEPSIQDSMYSLLQSDIPGLTTSLYPYQRRSAALMLQRESCPGKVLDPRLLRAIDHDGSEWYHDQFSGVVLREPRLYDGISGGILAEQMGSGKTIICLALILATRHQPAQAPELYQGGDLPVRKSIGSLADMAAACATRHSLPWRMYFDAFRAQLGYELDNCVKAVKRNPGHYYIPPSEPRRTGRYPPVQQPPRRVYLSKSSLVIVPNNLVKQWVQEIQKHTDSLEWLLLERDKGIPQASELLNYDVILFSQTRFERIQKETGMAACPLSEIHFKRCIVDEGHKLGNSKIGSKSNLLLGLESLQLSSRWIVTGTPSQGLFGVDDHTPGEDSPMANSPSQSPPATISDSTGPQEKKDLERIGSIAALYLKARPWANTIEETEDTPADWAVYVMQPKHSSRSGGRKNCLRATLNSLIVRHRLSEIGNLLPPVDEKVVVLEGSYQDRLSINLFLMMIIFNSVQSQRTDMDYLFHARQRKSLKELVHNLKQASFFGGSFFTVEEIAKAAETAQKFLDEKKVPISSEDEVLLREALQFAHLAKGNTLRNLSNQYHEMPVYVKDFPGDASKYWSLDGKYGDPVCTTASMLLALQKLVEPCLDAPASLDRLLRSRLADEGIAEKVKALGIQEADEPASPNSNRTQLFAGNTKLGDGGNLRKLRSNTLNLPIHMKEKAASALDRDIAEPLAKTQIVSTVSAKLSYLLDAIVKHKDEEQIIIFYENDNVAWYLASMLDVLQIPNLIYAKALSTERKAQYVNTFNYNPTFRVLLMDLTQAAFGLDMRAASRIYFINPVLNPQVEAQAIGRARRISQQRPVSVETLVLKDSIEEVIMERKKKMTQAEHRKCKSLLDDRPIYNWILNAKIIPMAEGQSENVSQMAPLQTPQPVFSRGSGRVIHPDDGLLLDAPPVVPKEGQNSHVTASVTNGVKRPHEAGPGMTDLGVDAPEFSTPPRPERRVRFTDDSEDD